MTQNMKPKEPRTSISSQELTDASIVGIRKAEADAYLAKTKAPKTLESLFPNWSLDTREMAWLWLTLKQHKFRLGNANFGLDSANDKMAAFIADRKLERDLEYGRRQHLIPEHKLQWIADKDDRLLRWLNAEIRRTDGFPNVIPPDRLSPREKLVACFDISSHSTREKIRILDLIQEKWHNNLSDERRHLKWFKGQNSKQKCEVAWEWLTEWQKKATNGVKPFTHYEDVARFFDLVEWSADSKELDIRKIKDRWKSRQVTARQIGRKQCNFLLSSEVDQQLQSMAKKSRLTRVEVIEALILAAAINGIPSIKPERE